MFAGLLGVEIDKVLKVARAEAEHKAANSDANAHSHHQHDPKDPRWEVLKSMMHIHAEHGRNRSDRKKNRG